MDVRLSLVLLAYQEAHRLGRSLDELARFVKEGAESTEVLVVVADSPDGTAELARARARDFSLLRVIDAGPRVGKGRDARLGMLEARGDVRIFMDADLATPLHHVETVEQRIRDGSHVVIGTRDLDRIHRGPRRWISVVGNRLVRLLVLPGIRDSQCGFKGFSAEAARQIFPRLTVTGWGFDVELLVIARELGYRIETVPVPDWKDVAGGTVGRSAAKAALSTFRDVLRIRRNCALGRYTK